MATYSPPKTGKSLLALDVAARSATGRLIFGQYLTRKLSVVYLDMEMTENDLAERLEDMGYGPEVDLSHLHYYLLPSLPPLDTRQGGEVLQRIVRLFKADLVIIDTTSRVISGKENDSDTLINLYRNTGLLVKQEGCTLWRLDHAGKKLDAGQRGTSAKNDDVDLVWEFSGSETAFVLRATHRRQSWIPEEVKITRMENPFRHEIVEDIYPTGTMLIVHILEELDIPLDWGRRRVRKEMAERGKSATNELLTAAIRYRKHHAEPRTRPRTRPETGSGTQARTHPLSDLVFVSTDTSTDTPGHVSGA